MMECSKRLRMLRLGLVVVCWSRWGWVLKTTERTEGAFGARDGVNQAVVNDEETYELWGRVLFPFHKRWMGGGEGHGFVVRFSVVSSLCSL